MMEAPWEKPRRRIGRVEGREWMVRSRRVREEVRKGSRVGRGECQSEVYLRCKNVSLCSDVFRVVGATRSCYSYSFGVEKRRERHACGEVATLRSFVSTDVPSFIPRSQPNSSYCSNLFKHRNEHG